MIRQQIVKATKRDSTCDFRFTTKDALATFDAPARGAMPAGGSPGKVVVK